MWVCMNVGFNIRNQAGYQFLGVCVSFPGVCTQGWGGGSAVQWVYVRRKRLCL